jgi:hypothetical protein
MEQEYARLQQLYYGSKEVPPTPSPSPEISIEEIKQVVEEVVEETPQIIFINDDIVICEICGGKYTHYNKNRHERTAKHKKKQLNYTVSDASTFVITTSEGVVPI